MGIVNRWRQFGRKYFWPHLLLGMVAASSSFILAPQITYNVSYHVVDEHTEPPLVQQLALLITLNALLKHETKPPVIIRDTQQSVLPASEKHQPGLWLAQVQGIRAGPVLFVVNDWS